MNSNEKTSKIYKINLNYLHFYSIYVMRGEKVYICTTTGEKAYSRNSLFVNMFGDIITITGNYVGNLRDSNITIIVK